MKKILAIVFIFAMFIFAPATFAYQIKADARTKRLPAGTKIGLVMSESVQTGELTEGDMFQSTTTSDIKVDNRTILPKGTLVRGTVKAFSKVGIASKSANLYLTFDHIVTPQGKQIPIEAGICNGFDIMSDGGISGGGNYLSELKRNVKKSGDIVAGATNWGIDTGDDLFKGGKYLLTPIGAVAGVFGGAIYLVGDSIIDIFRRGNEVIINQGQPFNIILIKGLDVPLS